MEQQYSVKPKYEFQNFRNQYYAVFSGKFPLINSIISIFLPKKPEKIFFSPENQRKSYFL